MKTRSNSDDVYIVCPSEVKSLKMPCIVPFCDPERYSFFLRFPRNVLLCGRWQQAIEKGTGESLPIDFDPLLAEICQQHFNEVDEYSEPVIFQNPSLGNEIQLAHCKLCLQFDFTDRMVTHWSGHIITDITIEELLKCSFGIQFEDLDRKDAICQQCIARLDVVASVRMQFLEGVRSTEKILNYIKEENRLRYKKVEKIETKLLTIVPIPQSPLPSASECIEEILEEKNS